MSQKIHTYKKIFLIVAILTLVGVAFGGGIVKPGSSGDIDNIINITGSDLLSTVKNIISKIITYIRLVLNGIAFLAMLYVGFLWVTSMGDEEKQSSGKNKIILVLVGLFLINIPDVLYKIFTGSAYTTNGFKTKISQAGGSLSSSSQTTSISEGTADKCNFFFCPQNFWGTGSETSVIQFLEVTMLVVAVVMFTIGGFSMMIGGGSESTNEKAKKRLSYGVIALLITGFIEMVYRAVFFQSSLYTTGSAITKVLIKGAKFFIYFAGPIAIIYIIIGGYYFITSAGNEERTDKGKKILLYTAFATIMLLLGYTFLIEIVGLNIF